VHTAFGSQLLSDAMAHSSKSGGAIETLLVLARAETLPYLSLKTSEKTAEMLLVSSTWNTSAFMVACSSSAPKVMEDSTTTLPAAMLCTSTAPTSTPALAAIDSL